MSVALPCVASRSVVVSVLAIGLWLGAAGRARAGPLNPLDFTSLGAFPTAPGGYTINTGINTGGPPTLTGPNGTSLTGVVSHGIAVFDFDSITLDAGSSININTALTPGSRPVALLSRMDETIAGAITVGSTAFSGPGMGQVGQFVPNPPGFGPGGSSGGSGGGGFGKPGSPGQSFDFDTPQGHIHIAGGAGGGTYGDLSQQLQMGSPGGPALGGGIGPGGLGGGAIELGALGVITITGTVLADGSPGGPGSGGGSGGAIYAHSFEAVGITGQLIVSGGPGGPSGGIGRDFIGTGGAGGEGRVFIQVVPEPASWVMGGTATLVGLCFAWRWRHTRKPGGQCRRGQRR